MPLNDLALRLGLALAIGFMIGLERGWKRREDEEGQRTAGLRTFSLIGLLGGIFGAFALEGGQVILAAGFIVVGVTLAAFMWREGEHERDYSATSLIAALLTFALGAYAVEGDQAAAAGAGVAAVLLLAHKELLHEFLTRVTWPELRSGLVLAAMTFIALPLLPNRPVDPWQALNPYELWLMTILIAAISFAGYAAVKMAGAGKGLLLSAALGGLVSSTAVTLSLARLARENRSHCRLLAAAILASGAVMMSRVLILAGLINVPLASSLAIPLAAATAVTALAAALLFRSPGGEAEDGARELSLRNPFDLAQVLKFGVLLTAIVFAVAIAREYFGDAGVFVLAALSGFGDVDAITLSMARAPDGMDTAVLAILIAVAVNSIAKAFYAGMAGGGRLGVLVLGASLAAILAGGAGWAYLR